MSGGISIMEQITLSIIIPAYNSEDTLRDSIESILSQNSKDFEIIIVNDGSVDGTEDICHEYQSKYKNICYISKENTGVSEARNVGMDNARGLFVAFLDSDDVWNKNYYDEELSKKLKDGYADVYVFSTCFSDMSLNIEEYVHVKSEEMCGGNKAVDMYYHSFCAFIFKREFLLDNNIRFVPKIKYGEDELFRSQCLYLADEVVAEDKLSFYYRNNRFSATKGKRNNKLFATTKLQVYYLLKDFFFEQYEKEGLSQITRNSRTVAYFADAVRLLSMTGYGYKKIKKLCDDEQIGVMLENDGKLYHLYYIQRNILQDYLKKPKWFYTKNRINGIWFYNALNLKHRMLKKIRKG